MVSIAFPAVMGMIGIREIGDKDAYLLILVKLGVHRTDKTDLWRPSCHSIDSYITTAGSITSSTTRCHHEIVALIILYPTRWHCNGIRITYDSSTSAI